MARIETDPNYTAPTFSRATAATDLFKKEDVQALAAAMSTHDHSTGKGVAIPFSGIPNGTITSAMIADATIDTADLKDGAVTSAKIADGTIATADLANQSVTNAKLASDTARANLLVNGGFEIWQRGNGPFSGSSAHCADRWVYASSGTDTFSVSRDISNQDTLNSGSFACAAVTFTLGTGGGLSTIYQPQPTTEFRLKNCTLTLSMRVRTSTANAVRLGGYDGSVWNYGAFHPGDGTYRTLTVTWTVGASATLASTGAFFAVSCTAYLDNAMLVVGSVAADYAPLHPADDLARCLRYYEIVGESGTGEVIVQGYQAAGANVYNTLMFKARKAVAPTVTKVGTWTLTNTAAGPTIDVQGIDSCRAYVTTTATGYTYATNNGAGQRLTVEANP